MEPTEHVRVLIAPDAPIGAVRLRIYGAFVSARSVRRSSLLAFAGTHRDEFVEDRSSER